MLDERPEGAISLGLHSNGTEVFYTKQVLDDGTWVGIWEWHRCPDRDGVTRCDGGYVPFDVPERAGTAWTVNSLEPLDLSPSILHPGCGFHGFVKQGRWVPA
jgi:hypothetical protein